MNFSVNYISLVALANFNPAIITPDFLINECRLEFGKPISISPIPIPVHRHIKFKEIEIDVNFDRLLIKEPGIKDIQKTSVLNTFDSIYSILPYTPVQAVGVNINFELVLEEKGIFEKIETFLGNPENIRKFYEVDFIAVNEKFNLIKRTKEWFGSVYRIDNVKGLIRHISIDKKKISYIINHNYEANNLSEDSTKLKLLLESYDQFCSEYFKFVKIVEAQK